MRVLHVHSGNIYGGIERAIETLTTTPCAIEMELALFFDARLADRCRASGCPVHVIGGVRLSRPLELWRVRRAFTEVVRRRRPDAIVCHSSWTRTVLGRRLKTCGVPFLLWQHTAEADHWLDGLASRTPPDFVIYNSAYTQSAVGDVFAGIPGAVLHYPVSPPLPDTARSRSAIRGSLGTPDDSIVVLQASRLEPRKGHEDFIVALGALRDEPRWVAWIAGSAASAVDDKYAVRLRALACNAGIERRVRWLGERGDVPTLMAAADVYCQPCQLPESFGVAFVEALYAGVPAVTTAFGGALEIIDGSCGILTEPGSRESLASALRLLIKDDGLRRRVAEGGPPRALELCEPATQVSRLEHILEGIVGRPVIAAASPVAADRTRA